MAGHTDCVRMVAVGVSADPDAAPGLQVVSAADDASLKVWSLDLAPGRSTAPAQPGGPQPRRMLEGHRDWVNVVLLARAAGRAGRVVSASRDHTLRVWDLDRAALLCSLDQPAGGHSGRVTAVALARDERWAVSASGDRTLKVWDLERGVLRHSLEGHTGWVNAVAVTPDGCLAVSAARDKTLKVWDLETGALLRTLLGHRDAVDALALTGDGRVVSASWDKSLNVWDLQTGALLHTLDRQAGGHTGWVHLVALTGDDRQAVSASDDKTLKVWDLETGALRHTLEGHTEPISGLALAGEWAVSASWDRTLRVWDLARGVQRHCLAGHTDGVTALALSADGRLAVSAAWDKTLRVWDLERGACLETFTGEWGMWSCAISQDGHWVVAGDAGGRVMIFEL